MKLCVASVALACGLSTVAMGQHLIILSGGAAGSGSAQVFGPGGATASDSISIANPFIPQSADELVQPSLFGVAASSLRMQSECGAINASLGGVSVVNLGVNSYEVDVGACGSGLVDGSVTTEIVFQVTSHARLRPTGGATSHIFVTCTSTGSEPHASGSAAAHAELRVSIVGGGTIFSESCDALGVSDSCSTFLNSDVIADIFPGITYKISYITTATSTSDCNGFGSGYAEAGSGFTLEGTCDPDLNADGNVDQDDVSYLISVVAGGPNPSGTDPDFNGDGNADQDDIAAVIERVGGGLCP